MRHRAGIFHKLRGTQSAHVFNAFHRAGRCNASHVLRKLLVAENGQTLFERELEPVAAGDAVAGPIVKIFVADDGFDVGKIHIRRRRLAGQHVLGVEDVEAFVFHRPHVEVAGRHNHEALQVQTQTKTCFVPRHAGHERVHGMLGFLQVARAHIDLQQVCVARAGGDALLAADELPRDQGEQIRWFFVRIHPFGKVTAIL